MITSTITTSGSLNGFAEKLEQQARLALSGAALVATATANGLAGKYATFHYEPVVAIPGGLESGVKADNPLLANIYDKGSLGKRRGALKQPGRRKQSWTVKQGHRTYTAHRGDVTNKGVEGTHWAGKSRSAGRKVLLGELDR